MIGRGLAVSPAEGAPAVKDLVEERWVARRAPTGFGCPHSSRLHPRRPTRGTHLCEAPGTRHLERADRHA